MRFSTNACRFFLPLLALVACSAPAPAEPHIAAVCTPLIPADDSSLLTHPSLWTLDSAPPLSAVQEQLLSTIRARPTTGDVHIARLSRAADSLLQLGKAIVLPVSPSRAAIAVAEAVTRRGPSDISWNGAIPDDFGRAMLVLRGQGVTGTLQSLRNYAAYKFEPLGGGWQALVCVDDSKYAPD